MKSWGFSAQAVIIFLILSQQVLHAQCSSEFNLLNRMVDADLLGRQFIWDEHNSEWRQSRSGEGIKAGSGILIVHLWADWCGPCKEEFPLLRDLEARMSAKYSGKVRFAYIAEIPNSPTMEQFIKDYRPNLPRGQYYQDTAELLARWLRPALGGRLTLPTTLVLDERRIVRHAIIGSLRSRTFELSQSVERLVELVGR